MFNNPKDIPFAVGIVWATYYMVRIVPALPRPPLAAAGQARRGDRHDDGGADRGPVAAVLSRSAARAGRDLASCRRPPRRLCWLDSAWTSLWRVLAPGRARRLSGHAAVLAMGADRPDREPAARPGLLLAPDFPVLHAVRRPVCSGHRPALDLPPDLYRHRAAGARSGAVALCSGRGGGRALARVVCISAESRRSRPLSSASGSFSRSPMRSRSRPCCSTACAISFSCCR